MACGMVHGGGTYEAGPWRESYDEAQRDLESQQFASSYGDTVCGIECRKEAQ